MKFIFFVLFIFCLLLTYGISMHNLGYYYGTHHGEHLQMMEYYKVLHECRDKVKSEPHEFNRGYDFYSYQYDSYIYNCLITNYNMVKEQ